LLEPNYLYRVALKLPKDEPRIRPLKTLAIAEEVAKFGLIGYVAYQFLN